MKNFKAFTFFLLFALLISTACSSPKYLSSPANFKQHVKGLFLEYTLGKPKDKIIGEIIEVNPEEVIILPIEENASIRTIPKSEILEADIIVASTSDNPKSISTWAGLVNLLSVSHGRVGVFSLPINLLTTISIGNSAAKSAYRIKYPADVSWDQMNKFARFPQGIPASIDRNEIN